MASSDRTSDDWDAVASASFVLLGTFRRNGTRVDVPVWIAPDGDDLVVTTERTTGKVKRVRRDGRVTLTPCGRFGKVKPGAPTVHGTAVIAGDAEGQPRADRAFRAKYGAQFRLVLGVERLVRRIQKRDGSRVILRISRHGER